MAALIAGAIWLSIRIVSTYYPLAEDRTVTEGQASIRPPDPFAGATPLAVGQQAGPPMQPATEPQPNPAILAQLLPPLRAAAGTPEVDLLVRIDAGGAVLAVRDPRGALAPGRLHTAEALLIGRALFAVPAGARVDPATWRLVSFSAR